MVWMIIPSFYPAIGGAETQARVLAKMLKSWAVDVRILTRRPRGTAGGQASAPDLNGVPVLRLASFKNITIDSLNFLLAGFWRLLLNGRGSIYHAHAVGSAGWLAVLAGRLLGGRSIVKLRTHPDVYEKTYASGPSRWQFERLIRMADCLLVVNNQVKNWLVNRGIPPGKILYLPNSVDTEVFSPAQPRQKEQIREELGIPADKLVVLYVGRLSEVKGVDILLGAWALLPEDLQRTTGLWIVGDGPERQNLERQAHQAGISSSVVFTGMRDNVVDYYHAADVFVLPSRAEGLSNAMVEAMACGLACAASAIGGALDLIVDEQNGCLYEPGNCTGLASRLVLLVNNSELRASISQRARKTIRESADIEASARQLKEVYQSLG